MLGPLKPEDVKKLIDTGTDIGEKHSIEEAKVAQRVNAIVASVMAEMPKISSQVPAIIEFNEKAQQAIQQREQAKPKGPRSTSEPE